MSAKRAQAEDVLNQIREIDGQLGHAVEAYNLATLKLDAIQSDLRTNARHLTIAKSSLAGAQRNLSDRLVAIYVNGGQASAVEVLLGAESLDDLLNRLDAVERVSGQDARVLHEVRRSRPRSSHAASGSRLRAKPSRESSRSERASGARSRAS